VGLTLAVLPVMSLVGFVVLGRFSTLGVLVVFQVMRRAADYGIAKPSREVLFTTVRREDKYKAKSFIDTFVYRAGDAVGALAEGASSAGMLVLVSVPVCLAWAVVAVLLGRMQRADAARI
jgi:ATP:ADP antiporter, AAA family